jgi:multiple sugar transport system permease protein
MTTQPRPSQSRAERRTENVAAVLMIAPAIITLLVVGLYPIIFAVNVSLREYMITRPANLGEFIGLANYGAVLTDDLFWAAMSRTTTLFVAVVPAQVIMGIAIALLLQSTRWRMLSSVLRVLLVIPFAMTPAVAGLLFRLVFNRDFGFLNYLVGLFGIEPINWLGDPTMAFVTVCLVDIWQWTPFVALVMLSGLALVPEDSVDAARLEVTGWVPIFRYIQLPYLLPGLTAVLIIRTADILKLFDMPFILTRGGPGVSTEYISLYIQRVGFRIFDMGTASAQAVLLLILCIVLSQIYISVFYREVAAG